MNIPYEHLRSWYDVKEGALAEFSFVQILNAVLLNYGITIREECQRIDGLLRRSCGDVKSQSRKLKGRRNIDFLGKSKKIAIRQDELVKVEQIEEYLKCARENAETPIEENKKLQERCEELYLDLQNAVSARGETEQKLEKLQSDYDEQIANNQELRDYIEKMGIPQDFRNTGKAHWGSWGEAAMLKFSKQKGLCGLQKLMD